MLPLTKHAQIGNFEAGMSDYNPFNLDILPDAPVQDVPSTPTSVAARSMQAAAAPAKQLPKSIQAQGKNGNNLPANIEEEMNKELDRRREGRMSTFTPERAAMVVEGVENGKTMESIAKELGTTRSTIWTWMQLVPEFNNAVARAREYQGHASADEAVNILDHVEVDDSTDPKLAMAKLRKAEQQARIRLELAKCFNFKQYGDKKQNLNLNVNAQVSPVDLANYA